MDSACVRALELDFSQANRRAAAEDFEQACNAGAAQRFVGLECLANDSERLVLGKRRPGTCSLRRQRVPPVVSVVNVYISLGVRVVFRNGGSQLSLANTDLIHVVMRIFLQNTIPG